MNTGRLLILFSWLALVLVGCNKLSSAPIANPSSTTPCSAAPPFAQTIEQLTSCLDTDASIEEIGHTLQVWDRIDDTLGEVSQADVVSGGGQEIVITYYPHRSTLDSVGKFAVLTRDRGQWHVLYDKGIAVGNDSSWWYEVAGVTDVTGDGYDDLLVRLHSPSQHFWSGNVVLLTAHPNDEDSALHIAFSREEQHFDTAYNFPLVGGDRPKAVQSVEKFDYYHVMTRTYTFEGESFALVAESTFPRNAADIPPQYRLGYAPDSDWHVYKCDKQDNSTGSFRSRICGMTTNGSQRRVIIDYLVSSILVSPDGQWLVFAAPPENFSPFDCQNTLYKMSLASEPFPLVSSSQSFRICAVHDLEWQPEGERIWIHFRYWNGRNPSNDFDSMPSYRVDFENGTLEQN